MLLFVEVRRSDPSEFITRPVMAVEEEGGRYVMRVRNAASVSHTLAAVALEMSKGGRAPEVLFGWTEESPVSGTLGVLLFGEGNIPWMVRDLVRRAEPDPARRPRVTVTDS
jgi:hypothetical protein